MSELESPIAPAATPTPVGKVDDGDANNEDKTVVGLSKRLEKEVKKNAALAKQVADFMQTPSEETEDKRTKTSKLERENAALKLGIKYPDIAPVIRGAIEKGLDPSWIDEEFVATLRSAGTSDTDSDDQSLNAPRITGTSNADTLKGLKSLFED